MIFLNIIKYIYFNQGYDILKKKFFAILLASSLICNIPVSAAYEQNTNSALPDTVSVSTHLNTAKSSKTATEKKRITKTIKALFSAVKKYDLDKASNCFITPSYIPLFLNTEDGFLRLVKTQNKKIKYQIKSISVKGKKATAKIRCTYINAAPAILLTEQHAPHASMDDYWNEIYYHVQNGLFSKKTVTITLSMKKIGNTWYILNPSNKRNMKLENAINCNFDGAFK